jgi:iron complex outermembrane receptor protein
VGALFDKLPVRLSVGNVENPGILKNTSFERTTTSLSLNPVLFDNHLKLILMEIYHLVKIDFRMKERL